MNFVRLKKIREDNDNTQQEVAEVLNVKRETYASWECGTDTIPLMKVFEYAIYYKKSIDYIFELSNNNSILIFKNKKINVISVGEKLKKIRKKMNLSQTKFAESIGINQSTWWAYENGKTLVSTTCLISLAKKYSYSIDWIWNRI